MRYLNVVFLFLLFSVSCSNNNSCYKEPNPKEFQSIAGHWDFVGFADDYANELICFDTAGASADTSEFSFTTDGWHYQGIPSGTIIDTYTFSNDKTELYFLGTGHSQGDTIASAKIGKLTKNELVLTYLPRLSGDKIRSEYYRRINP